MDAPLIRSLLAAVEAGDAIVLATVIDTSRSVPRHAGSKMLVHRDGRTTGSIGGGEMEARVIEEALGALGDGRPRLVHFDLLDPRRGDPGVCGGEVHLYLEPYMPTPTVFVIGCGHVGRATIDLAHWLGYRTVGYDDRADQVTPEALPLADIRLSGPLADAIAAAPITPETHVVVVTRNMGLDLDLLPTLLATPARSIGVMGSARRWDTTRQELTARGVSPADLDRVLSPVGVELNAETPEEIAVSILAEVVGIRRGAR